MESAQRKRLALAIVHESEQRFDLRLSDEIVDRLTGIHREARRLAARGIVVDAGILLKVRDRLRQRHRAGRQADVDADSRRAVAHQVNHLLPRAGIVVVEPLTHQHLFAVERPAFGEDAVVVHVPDEIRIVIGVAELQEVPGYALVAEQRQHRLPRLLRRRSSDSAG